MKWERMNIVNIVCSSRNGKHESIEIEKVLFSFEENKIKKINKGNTF